MLLTKTGESSFTIAFMISLLRDFSYSDQNKYCVYFYFYLFLDYTQAYT